MKRTEIHHQNTADGRVLVTKIKNVASVEEIGNKFGVEVQRLYLSKTLPAYVKSDTHNGKCVEVGINTAHGVYDFLKVNRVYLEVDFQKKITLMKRAGERLGQIIKKVAEYETQIIKI